MATLKALNVLNYGPRTVVKAMLKRLGFKLVRENFGNIRFAAPRTIMQEARERGISVTDLVAFDLYPQGVKQFLVLRHPRTRVALMETGVKA